MDTARESQPAVDSGVDSGGPSYPGDGKYRTYSHCLRRIPLSQDGVESASPQQLEALTRDLAGSNILGEDFPELGTVPCCSAADRSPALTNFGLGPPEDLVVVMNATWHWELQGTIQESVSEVLSVMALTGCFDRLSILAYFDYCQYFVTRSSPWVTSAGELTRFIHSLYVDRDDWPEAAKTAAAELLAWREEEGTIGSRGMTVVWLTDGPPHNEEYGGINRDMERQALGKERSDWVWLCRALCRAGVRVCPIMDSPGDEWNRFYILLADITGGTCLRNYYYDNKEAITSDTVNLLLGLMGGTHSISAEKLTFSQPWEEGYDSQSGTQSCIPDELVSERRHMGFLGDNTGIERLPDVSCVDLSEHPLRAVPSLRTDLTRLAERFAAEEAYRRTVYQVFTEELLLPHRILAVTTNSVFGALWRAICRRRDDKRSAQCQERLQAALLELDEDGRQKVQQWLQSSYDRTGELRRLLQEHKGPRYPALVLDRPVDVGPTDPPPTPQEMLELARSCHPAVLRRAGQLLTSLRVVEGPPQEEMETEIKNSRGAEEEGDQMPVTELPLSLSEKDLFAFLPHLLAPGAVFSLRPALVLAAVAVSTGSVLLKDRALKFLELNRGKWFTMDQPENYARSFARLMLRVHLIGEGAGAGVLEQEEERFFHLVCTVAGLSTNRSTTVTLHQAVTPVRRPRPDNKRLCVRCGEMRSFTLLTEGDVCGLCRRGTSALAYPGPRAVPQGKAESSGASADVGLVQDWASPEQGPAVKDPLGNGMSYWNECGMCRGHYAVVRSDNLHVSTPKCYFCVQKKGTPPLRCCSACGNKFLDPCLPEGAGNGPWVCPPCQVDPAASFEEVSVDLKTLLAQNEGVVLERMLGLRVAQGQKLFDGISLFKSISNQCFSLVDQERVGEGAPVGLRYRGKEVRNEAEVVECIRKWVLSGKAERDDCMLCFEAIRKDLLVAACGRRRCGVRACQSCLGKWYGEARPGHVLVLSTLQCPFCKQAPAPKTLLRFNRQVYALIGRNDPLFLSDPAWIYAWCIRCYRACKFMERVCDPDGAAAAPTEFLCEECQAQSLEMMGSKPCPKCKFDVVKVSGCDHITCSCGEHWCWRCGKGGFDEYNIYGHIGTEHGGMHLEGVGDE